MYGIRADVSHALQGRIFCLFPFVDLLERVAKEWGLLALFTGARVVERIARPLIAMASLPGARGGREPSRGVERQPFWLKNEFRSSEIIAAAVERPSLTSFWRDKRLLLSSGLVI